MDQGDDVQQVILTQLLQSIGQLLHVYVLVSPALLLGGVLVAHAVGLGGTRLGEEGEELRLGVAESLQWRVSDVLADK